MGTYLSEIYDLAMQLITDYRLVELYNTSQEDFENFMQGWLYFAINDFNVCDQDLTFNETEKQFVETLSISNRVILATLIMKYWLQKLVNDVTQMNLHVTDRDFRLASEAMNLREKVTHLNVIKEQCSQLLIDYAYKRVEWTDWYNQDFEGA